MRKYVRAPGNTFGLGWLVTPTSTYGAYAHHNGSYTGARTYLRIYQDRSLVIAIMANRRQQIPLDIGPFAASLVNIIK